MNLSLNNIHRYEHAGSWQKVKEIKLKYDDEIRFILLNINECCANDLDE